ncbi:MAG TPA: murein transglycosylase domain-containing protein [Gammaproteobacteria bacterium]|nr:murein transglycosylase domain-containing protein [Gammaproteobacteria bacterium]
MSLRKGPAFPRRRGSRSIFLTLAALGAVLAWGPTHPAGAQGEGFRNFRSRQKSGFDTFQGRQEQGGDRQEKAFAAYRKRVRAAFAAYKRKAAEIWGGEGPLVPDRKQWVSYRRHMRERRVVDFKGGQARFEVALKPGQTEVPARVRKWLEDAIVESLTRGPDQRSMEDIARHPGKVRPGGEPLLAGMVAGDDGRPVTAREVRSYAHKVVEERARVEKVKGQDGRTLVAVAADVPLIPDHLRKRAEKYQSVVDRQAERQGLTSKLLFAVMETESYFNPMARSPIPAFGLMQLVPGSGGREAYRIVHGEDKKPSERFLYDPTNNVQLGAAYLHRIYYDYMRGIEDHRARLWCTVAAYNTGPGNLYRTFADSGRRKAAVRRINRMDSGEVLHYLEANLPYKETRSYVRKVHKRMPKYGRL